jgi:hypothetical protein
MDHRLEIVQGGRGHSSEEQGRWPLSRKIRPPLARVGPPQQLGQGAVGGGADAGLAASLPRPAHLFGTRCHGDGMVLTTQDIGMAAYYRAGRFRTAAAGGLGSPEPIGLSAPEMMAAKAPAFAIATASMPGPIRVSHKAYEQHNVAAPARRLSCEVHEVDRRGKARRRTANESSA